MPNEDNEVISNAPVRYPRVIGGIASQYSCNDDIVEFSASMEGL